MSLRRRVMGQGASGGVRKVEGTFTLAADGAPPVLTHNFGTKKIALIIFPIGGVVAHAGYRNFCAEFINVPEFMETGYKFSVDISNYNSNYPDPIISSVATNGLPKVANGNASPWTSQRDSLVNGTFYGIGTSGYTITDDSIKATSQFASGTYKYIIFALE